MKIVVLEGKLLLLIQHLVEIAAAQGQAAREKDAFQTWLLVVLHDRLPRHRLNEGAKALIASVLSTLLFQRFCCASAIAHPHQILLLRLRQSNVQAAGAESAEILLPSRFMAKISLWTLETIIYGQDVVVAVSAVCELDRGVQGLVRLQI